MSRRNAEKIILGGDDKIEKVYWVIMGTVTGENQRETQDLTGGYWLIGFVERQTWG